VHLVRSLLDEVFGPDNFVAQITFKKTSGAGSFAGGTTTLASTADYLLWYAKDKENVKYRQVYREKAIGGDGTDQYTWIETGDGKRLRIGAATKEQIAEGRYFRPDNMTSVTVREAATTVFPIEYEGRAYYPSSNRGWSTNQNGVKNLQIAK
jgi:adenine-specific DNA-methyltransferase